MPQPSAEYLLNRVGSVRACKLSGQRVFGEPRDTIRMAVKKYSGTAGLGLIVFCNTTDSGFFPTHKLSNHTE